MAELISERDEETLFALRGEREARRELVSRYDWLAHHLGRRFGNRRIAVEDLVQVARYGLLNAIDRFDRSRGVKFATFATRTMVGEIKHYLRDHSWSMRVPRRLQNLWLRASTASEALSQDLGREPTVGELSDYLDEGEMDLLEAMDAGRGYTVSSLDRPVASVEETPLASRLGASDPRLERSPRRVQAAKAIGTLPDREKRMLYLRFFEGKTQDEIAQATGVSQVHVSRVLRRTLGDLRRLVRGR